MKLKFQSKYEVEVSIYSLKLRFKVKNDSDTDTKYKNYRSPFSKLFREQNTQLMKLLTLTRERKPPLISVQGVKTKLKYWEKL